MTLKGIRQMSRAVPHGSADFNHLSPLSSQDIPLIPQSQPFISASALKIRNDGRGEIMCGRRARNPRIIQHLSHEHKRHLVLLDNILIKLLSLDNGLLRVRTLM